MTGVKSLVIAANHGEVGGGEVMALHIAQAASELGYEVTIVAPDVPNDLLAAARRYSTVAVHARTTAQYLRRLRAWTVAQRPDLLWCNGLRPAFATAGLPNRVVHLHQVVSAKHRALSAVAQRGALVTLMPSESAAESAAGARVLWNWTADLPYAPRTPESASEVRLGYLGRLTEAKGILVLCDALQRLCGADPGRFELVLAGETRFVSAAEKEQIDGALARLPCPIRRLGWVSPESFRNNVDIAVFPSVAKESFGLVVAEAMGMGLPHVMSDIPAFREVAGAGHRWIAPATDAAALAGQIRLAASEIEVADLDRARELWEKHFSPAAGKRRLASVLESLN